MSIFVVRHPGVPAVASAPRRAAAGTRLVDSRATWSVLALGLGTVAFLARLVPVLRGGGLFGLGNYDDGVYFSAAVALSHGVVPYRDFLLLHPPGIVVLLWPFAMLGHVTGSAVAFAVARVAFMALGATNAVLVAVLLRRSGTPAVLVGGLAYALALPAVYIGSSTLLETPASTCLLAALVLLGRAAERRAWAPASGAGLLLALAADTKIWNVVVGAAVLVWVVLRSGRRRTGALRPRRRRQRGGGVPAVPPGRRAADVADGRARPARAGRFGRPGRRPRVRRLRADRLAARRGGLVGADRRRGRRRARVLRAGLPTTARADGGRAPGDDDGPAAAGPVLVPALPRPRGRSARPGPRLGRRRRPARVRLVAPRARRRRRARRAGRVGCARPAAAVRHALPGGTPGRGDGRVRVRHVGRPHDAARARRARPRPRPRLPGRARPQRLLLRPAYAGAALPGAQAQRRLAAAGDDLLGSGTATLVVRFAHAVGFSARSTRTVDGWPVVAQSHGYDVRRPEA